MKDYQASLEKLRRDAAEAALIRDLATDQTKRDSSTGCTSISIGSRMKLSRLCVSTKRHSGGSLARAKCKHGGLTFYACLGG